MAKISAAASQRSTSNHSRTSCPARLDAAPSATKIEMIPAAKKTDDSTARRRTSGDSCPSPVIWFMLTPAM